jgi:hypothetical protein
MIAFREITDRNYNQGADGEHRATLVRFDYRPSGSTPSCAYHGDHSAACASETWCTSLLPSVAPWSARQTLSHDQTPHHDDARDDQGNLLLDTDRLTRFGKFLRAASLDELPELWNVVVGDMSLVGPRPLLMQYLDRYTPEQARRHEVRPGVTGWAQVNGRNAISWEQKFAYDVWYVDNLSFWLDLKILGLTVRKGISRTGQATMGEFRGRPDQRYNLDQ